MLGEELNADFSSHQWVFAFLSPLKNALGSLILVMARRLYPSKVAEVVRLYKLRKK